MISERFGELSKDKGGTEKLGSDGLRALEKILAMPFRLSSPLTTTFSRDDVLIDVLTQQQFHILRAIDEVARVAISGSAGIGKTVLAIEEARRCQNNGIRTLFVCHNRGLASQVRRSLSDAPLITTMTFHGLCVYFANRAKLETPEGISRLNLFEEVWPKLLVQAFERVPNERYGAIIVDEGQDFLPISWKH